MESRLLFSILGVTHDCLAMDEGFGAGDIAFYGSERMSKFLCSTGTLLQRRILKICFGDFVAVVLFLMADVCILWPIRRFA